MGSTNWRAGIISGIALVAIIVAILVWPNSNAASPAAAETSGEAQSAEDLRVTPGDLLPEAAQCESDEFIANSMPSTNHKWSDSVSVPFTSSSPGEMFSDVLKENCGNPTFLLMNVEGLSSVEVEDGLTIGDINPWMSEFVTTFKADPFSLLTKKAGSGDDIFVTPEFTQVAEMVNTILLRLKVEDVSTEKTITNWHIAARDGLAVGDMPIATLNPKQYKGDFLRLEYTLKGQECPPFAIGFNTGDKRFAELSVDCGPTPTPTPTPTPPPPPPPPPPPTPEITVCVISGSGKGSVITIAETAFNSGKHSKDLRHPACNPKDPDDSREEPPGKPPAPAPTDPPEKEPPVVVTPNPDEKPGDETDVRAPDADPAPSPRPTPPPNEGGDEDNDTDPGGF